MEWEAADTTEDWWAFKAGKCWEEGELEREVGMTGLLSMGGLMDGEVMNDGEDGPTPFVGTPFTSASLVPAPAMAARTVESSRVSELSASSRFCPAFLLSGSMRRHSAYD